MTCAARYGIKELRPFVESWQRNVADTDLVVFADAVEPETVAWLRSVGAEVLPASFTLVRMGTGYSRFAQHSALRAGVRILCAWMNVWGAKGDARPGRVREAMLDLSGSRFAHYLRFLELHRARYTAVVLADCRDLVFQASPFPVTELHVFAENETIGRSHFAKRWLQLTYGHTIWRELSDRPFLCSGVVVGEAGAICTYLGHMARECANVMAITGEDQAVHNFVIHRGLVTARQHLCGDGVAVNLNGIKASALRIEQGRITDTSGRPVPIVHQYDRVAGLQLAEVTLANR